MNSGKHNRLNAVDTPDANTKDTYTWSGRGRLRVASSRWQILGYGHKEGSWVVTYFQKSLFTPTGIDIYAHRRGGLSEELIARADQG